MQHLNDFIRSNTVRCFTIRARNVEIVSRVCKKENPGYPGFFKIVNQLVRSCVIAKCLMPNTVLDIKTLNRVTQFREKFDGSLNPIV